MPKECTLRGAECVSERTAWQASETGLWIVVDFAVLDPEAADLNEVTVGLVVLGDKLGDNGDILGRVDGLVRSVEVALQPPRVNVATVLVASGTTLCT